MNLLMQNIKHQVFHDGGKGISNGIMGCSCPHHRNNQKGGSLLDLRVGHKCNVSTRELKDEGLKV
jgi:hypothetical protein